MQEQMSDIIEEYRQVRPKYEEYTKKIYELIRTLINESSIKTYSVDKRTKGIGNLEEKLRRKGNAYNQLSEITDLSGIRIVCYFSSEVEQVAKIIEQNFTVIPELSIDKKKLLDPDRFGYLSLHYVVKLSDARKDLPEYRRCQDLLCEIQIRSILQHSWAEIEHDLGYKSSIEIPREIKRRFYRLSGLLDLADDEFMNLRIEIGEYTNSLKNQEIAMNEEIFIDAISLNEYIMTSSTVREIDESIANLEFCSLVDRPPDSVFDLIRLSYLNITKIRELDKTLKDNRDEILFFTQESEMLKKKKAANIKRGENCNIRKGVSILYLGYILIAKTMDILKIRDYLYTQAVTSSINESIANDILDTYKKYLEIHKR